MKNEHDTEQKINQDILQTQELKRIRRERRASVRRRRIWVSLAVIAAAVVSLPLLSEVQAANDRIIITAMAKAKNLFISQISVGSRFFPVIRSFRYFKAADIHYLRHISGNGDRQPPFIS